MSDILSSLSDLLALSHFRALFFSIGTAVLSQYVDDFTLVFAFFLFVLGCINIFLGPLFRQSAKSRRSIMSWREEARGVLPTTNLRTAATLDLNRSGSSRSGQSPNSSTMYEEKAAGDVTEFGAVRNPSRAGYGFGRQGEKAAGLKGFLICSASH